MVWATLDLCTAFDMKHLSKPEAIQHRTIRTGTGAGPDFAMSYRFRMPCPSFHAAFYIALCLALIFGAHLSGLESAVIFFTSDDTSCSSHPFVSVPPPNRFGESLSKTAECTISQVSRDAKDPEEEKGEGKAEGEGSLVLKVDVAARLTPAEEEEIQSQVVVSSMHVGVRGTRVTAVRPNKFFEGGTCQIRSSRVLRMYQGLRMDIRDGTPSSISSMEELVVRGVERYGVHRRV